MNDLNKVGKRAWRRKKVRYYKVSFKLTERQKKKINRYCRLHKMTSVKMIKQAINEYLLRHAADIPEEEHVLPNQLALFDFEEAEKITNE